VCESKVVASAWISNEYDEYWSREMK